ncbi:MAG: hypothetical protein M3450_07760, partial [Actinomycetota bacterium]|nr:hypothetical protein [Actinomycetota bacterium]
RDTVPSVETVFALLRQCLPSVSIVRLAVKYPADDDNLWFIRADGRREVQIGSHPGGRPPFLIEGDLPDQRHETSEVAEAVDSIVAWLGSP